MKNRWQILKILMPLPRRVFMNRFKGIRSSALNWIINVRWQGGSATCGASALALISPTQIWQITGRERDLMNAMRFMHYSLAWTVDGRWCRWSPLVFGLCHIRQGGCCAGNVEVVGAADWWPLEARARAEQWLPLIFMHTEAPHELRCATDAVGALEADAASLISKCESQSSRHTHTHTNKHKHTHTVRVWWG